MSTQHVILSMMQLVCKSSICEVNDLIITSISPDVYLLDECFTSIPVLDDDRGNMPGISRPRTS